MTAMKTEDAHVTVVGSVFAFAIAINSRLSSFYELKVLASKHYEACDEYNALKHIFNSLEIDHESGRLVTNEYDSACKEFIRISKYTHLESCSGLNHCCF